MTPYTLPSGGTLQSGLGGSPMPTGRAQGRLLRGVVVATYVTDDPKNPGILGPDAAYAVYCDVLAYSAGAGPTPTLVPKCLVSQARAGIQGGDIWHPRAATLDASGAPLSLSTSNPLTLDGDHVLVGFMDDSLSSPVILRALPHPLTDVGQPDAEPALGQRVKLRQVDGSPDLRKHLGVVAGVTGSADFEVSTLYANDGQLSARGVQPAPPTSGEMGNVRLSLHARAQRLTQLLQMDTPASPQEALREVLSATLWQLHFTMASAHLQVSDSGGNALDAVGSGADAHLQVGDGKAHVCIAEHLMALYADLKVAFDNHTHASSLGPTGPAQGSGFIAPAWDSRIASSHVSIPDEV